MRGAADYAEYRNDRGTGERRGGLGGGTRSICLSEKTARLRRHLFGTSLKCRGAHYTLICAAFCRSCATRIASLTTRDDGLLKLAPVASAKLSSTSDPAWCVAAR